MDGWAWQQMKWFMAYDSPHITTVYDLYQIVHNSSLWNGIVIK